MDAESVNYAVLRPSRTGDEPDAARVLMILESADAAEHIASELRHRGTAAEVAPCVGTGPNFRLRGWPSPRE